LNDEGSRPKEYEASYALLELAKELGLDRALYSRKEVWVQDCLAMIVGRNVYAGGKLATWSSRKSPHLNPTSKQSSIILKCACSHTPEI
jgi:hypothetical protein